MTADNEVYRALKDNYTTVSYMVREEEEKIESIYTAIQRYVRLKNDYSIDVEKFKAAQKAKQIIGRDVALVTQCPLCENKIDFSDLRPIFQINDSDKLVYELNSLKRRIKELDYIIGEQRNEAIEHEATLSRLINERQDAKRLLDDNAESFISPYISERDGFVSQLATLRQKQEELRSRKKLRKQYERIQNKIGEHKTNLEGLEDKLKAQKENAPSEGEVLYNLGEEFRSYMHAVKIKNPTGLKISDKKYLPVVRGTDYQEINSGGLRTITSIGYLSSIIAMARDNDLNIPPFLMIDTVGKYLGKTKESYLQETESSADETEEMSDPSKYRNIYEHLIDLNESFEKNSQICQIILVDNDVPPEIQKEYGAFVVAHFSSAGAGGLPVGLIDDIDSLG